jgi:hypothetical protein
VLDEHLTPADLEQLVLRLAERSGALVEQPPKNYSGINTSTSSSTKIYRYPGTGSKLAESDAADSAGRAVERLDWQDLVRLTAHVDGWCPHHQCDAGRKSFRQYWSRSLVFVSSI